MGKNPLQKRVMTIQVAVIASDDDTGRRHCDCEARSRKQSRWSDNVRDNDFVIISAVQCLGLPSKTGNVKKELSNKRNKSFILHFKK